MLAISFMNEMRVARIEFAAYLQSSALAVSVSMIGAPVRVNGAYSSRITRSARFVAGSTPTTTRSGFMKSSMAAPCFRNSGLLTTLNGCVVSAAIVLHRGGRADGHGALVDDDGVLVDRPADGARDVEHVPQVGRSVFALRRADGDEHDVRRLDRRRQVGRERQPLFGDVAADDLFEPRLVDRHLAGGQRGDLCRVLVHARDRVAVLGQAGAQHESDVTGPHDGDFHWDIRY